MARWIIGIIVSSVVMSLILKIIPENSVKKTVHTAFGIIFLLVTAVPVLNMFSDGFDPQNIDMLFKSKIGTVSDSADDNYIKNVISEYSSSVETLAEKKLLEENGVICDVSVTVCKDIKSSLFGSVLGVKCVVSDEKPETSGDKGIITNVPLIEDIEISFGGNSKEPEFDYDGIRKTLSDTLGVSAEICEIDSKGV
ncbi:MAG: hypothetical protein E7384_05910 [Ruminococcaceae bacterium]|nr:hypothetical protein [Oscillospiraceae bacterium]